MNVPPGIAIKPPSRLLQDVYTQFHDISALYGTVQALATGLAAALLAALRIVAQALALRLKGLFLQAALAKCIKAVSLVVI